MNIWVEKKIAVPKNRIKLSFKPTPEAEIGPEGAKIAHFGGATNRIAESGLVMNRKVVDLFMMHPFYKILFLFCPSFEDTTNQKMGNNEKCHFFRVFGDIFFQFKHLTPIDQSPVNFNLIPIALPWPIFNKGPYSKMVPRGTGKNGTFLLPGPTDFEAHLERPSKSIWVFLIGSTITLSSLVG